MVETLADHLMRGLPASAGVGDMRRFTRDSFVGGAARCVLRGRIHQPLFVASLPGLSYPRMLSEFWKPIDPLALC